LNVRSLGIAHDSYAAKQIHCGSPHGCQSDHLLLASSNRAVRRAASYSWSGSAPDCGRAVQRPLAPVASLHRLVRTDRRGRSGSKCERKLRPRSGPNCLALGAYFQVLPRNDVHRSLHFVRTNRGQLRGGVQPLVIGRGDVATADWATAIFATWCALGQSKLRQAVCDQIAGGTLWLMRPSGLGELVMAQGDQVKHVHALRARADEVRAVAHPFTIRNAVQPWSGRPTPTSP
jgi:hypothetical protein